MSVDIQKLRELATTTNIFVSNSIIPLCDEVEKLRAELQSVRTAHAKWKEARDYVESTADYIEGAGLENHPDSVALSEASKREAKAWADLESAIKELLR